LRSNGRRQKAGREGSDEQKFFRDHVTESDESDQTRPCRGQNSHKSLGAKEGFRMTNEEDEERERERGRGRMERDEDEG
jgi:hypothetical protein